MPNEPITDPTAYENPEEALGALFGAPPATSPAVTPEQIGERLGAADALNPTAKHGKKYTVITGRGYRPREIALGRWKWAAFGFVVLYLSIEVFIPFLVLLWASVLPYLQLPVGRCAGIVDAQTLC